MEIQALNTDLYPNGRSTGILSIDSNILYDLLFDETLPQGLARVTSHYDAPDLRTPVLRL